MTDLAVTTFAAFFPSTLSGEAVAAVMLIAGGWLLAMTLVASSVVIHVLNTSLSAAREVAATVLGWSAVPVIAVASAVAVGMVG